MTISLEQAREAAKKLNDLHLAANELPRLEKQANREVSLKHLEELQEETQTQVAKDVIELEELENSFVNRLDELAKLATRAHFDMLQIANLRKKIFDTASVYSGQVQTHLLTIEGKSIYDVTDLVNAASERVLRTTGYDFNREFCKPTEHLKKEILQLLQKH